MAKKKRDSDRTYLPRSTMSYAGQRVIQAIADQREISFGKALEIVCLESVTFNQVTDDLISDTSWFANDVKKMRGAVE